MEAVMRCLWRRWWDAYGGGDEMPMEAVMRCLWRRRWDVYRGGDLWMNTILISTCKKCRKTHALNCELYCIVFAARAEPWELWRGPSIGGLGPSYIKLWSETSQSQEHAEGSQQQKNFFPESKFILVVKLEAGRLVSKSGGRWGRRRPCHDPNPNCCQMFEVIFK